MDRLDSKRKNELLPLIVASLDSMMLKATPKAGKNDPPDELLFDILMTRFEIMKPYRVGLNALMDQALHDPTLAFTLYKALSHTLSLCLSYAYKKPKNIEKKHHTFLFVGAYFLVFAKWLHDDTPDLSLTMVNLNSTIRTGLNCRVLDCATK